MNRARGRTVAGETLRGELLSFRVAGSDFWGFGTVRTRHDGGEVSITGKLLGANVGDTVELQGSWDTHARYGKQLKVRSCVVVLPNDATGVVGWLSAKLPQVSSRRAEQLVERFGVEGLWKLLDAEDANALCVVDGITPSRAEEIIAAYRDHKLDRDRFVRFKQWGLTDNQIARVIAEWEDEAEERITDNPYALIECVPGFGWKRADEVALRMGLRRDDKARLCAGLMHAMDTATQAGHCYSSSGKLVAITTEKVCAISDENAVRSALDDLLQREKLVRIEQNIYLPKIAKAEGRLAQVFAARAKRGRERAA